MRIERGQEPGRSGCPAPPRSTRPPSSFRCCLFHFSLGCPRPGLSSLPSLASHPEHLDLPSLSPSSAPAPPCPHSYCQHLQEFAGSTCQKVHLSMGFAAPHFEPGLADRCSVGRLCLARSPPLKDLAEWRPPFASFPEDFAAQLSGCFPSFLPPGNRVVGHPRTRALKDCNATLTSHSSPALRALGLGSRPLLRRPGSSCKKTRCKVKIHTLLQ